MESNLGFYLICAICGERFWTEDGYNICSASCDYKYQSESEGEGDE